MSRKRKIYEQCCALISAKLKVLQDKLRDLTDSAANETKSSAGDKYETSRAMLHMEQDGVRRQIADITAQQAVLNVINPDAPMLRAGPGSLVVTQRGTYFVSVALGMLRVDGEEVIALSQQSPLGSKLKGLQAGDRLEMNGMELLIETVY